MPITVVKSYRPGNVGLRITLKCRGSSFGGDSSLITANTELTVEEARNLSNRLTVFADEVEAKARATQAAEQRRKRWRDREIAAGRMMN